MIRKIAAYKTIRDVAIFTNKRLILRDAQGLSGKKVEIYSLTYQSISLYLSITVKLDYQF
ncbi:PH domain-containing protein [Acinetobacter soli]